MNMSWIGIFEESFSNVCFRIAQYLYATNESSYPENLSLILSFPIASPMIGEGNKKIPPNCEGIF